MSVLRACFPYYGYKGAVSSEVWKRLGNPPNYVEPFFGSGAVLLQRPGGAGKREVINDKSGGLANFWRSVQADPAGVLEHAVWICSESDLHARNAFFREALPDLTARLEGDPGYYDSRLAGYWCYVQCLAIGEVAYARGPWVRRGGLLVKEPVGDGVRRNIPCDQSRGIQRAIPTHSDQGIRKSVPEKKTLGILRRKSSAEEWIHDLSCRLSEVRILCGDWARGVKPTYTTQHGLTGVFLDPPYDDCWKTYSDHDPLTEQICSWCAENGEDPKLRIALCGYEGTLSVDLVALGWAEFGWKAGGGRVTVGGASDLNRDRERIWFSPHCLDSVGKSEQLDLLAGLG
jgi:DNA adenine methylase